MDTGERGVIACRLRVGLISTIDMELGNSRAVSTDKSFFGLKFSSLNYIKISRWLIERVAGQIVDEQRDDRADGLGWKEIRKSQRGFAVVWPLAVSILGDRESGHWGSSATDYKKETGSERPCHVDSIPN
jgi:hypothetical protein